MKAMGDRRKIWACAAVALAVMACVLGAMSCRKTDLTGTESSGRPMRLAAAAEAEENWQEAIRWYETALRHRPQMALAHRCLAVIFHERMQPTTPENLAAAIYHYNKFLALAKETPDSEVIQEQIERCVQHMGVLAAGDTSGLASRIDELRGSITERDRQIVAAETQIRNLNEQLAKAKEAAARQTPPPSAGQGTLRAPATPPSGASRAGSAVAGVRTYVVKSGDTLTAIAKKHDTTIAAIVRMNPNVNPDRLKIGTTLNIPPP